MFIGHYAVGLASKKFAPRASLGVLIAAPILLDLLWPIFVLLGLEHVTIEPNTNPFLRFTFDSYPISHGLLGAVAWATLFACIYGGLTRYIIGAAVIWCGVVSHWFLDYIVHRPDLPLWARGQRLYGLGLWNHKWITIAVELFMLAIATWIYVRETRAKDRVGDYAMWAFVIVLVGFYFAVTFAPPPSSVRKMAIGALVTILFVPWAWWLDSHRQPREIESALPMTPTTSAADLSD